MVDNGTEIFPTVVWSAGAGCHGNCGQKLHVKDGELIKTEGDEDHPWNHGRACPRVLALKQYMYHPDRITHPLKRVGERDPCCCALIPLPSTSGLWRE